MTTAIAITKFFDDWDLFSDGDGVITPNSDNTLVACVAGAATGRAYVRKRLPARPGETITVEFVARNISGEPQASIDYPSTGTSASIVDINKTDVENYKFSYTVPYTADETEYVQISIGVFSTPAGNTEISTPRVTVQGAPQGFLRSWCLGLVKLERAAGVVTASINDNFVKTGISSVNYDVASKTLEVTTLKANTSADFNIRPIFDAGMTTDLLPDVTAKAGRYTPSTGLFDVQFSNGTGSFIDITSLMSDGEIAYVWVRAGGL
jgi:hypothetical protein